MADEDVKVISGIELDRESVKLKPGLSKIFRSGEMDVPSDKVQIVGGDAESLGAAGAPAIVIEKKGDAIAKIIVRCPCGRHAELLCEYEEGGPQQ